MFLDLHLKTMTRNIFGLIIVSVILSACSSSPLKLPEEKGTACLDRISMPGSATLDQVKCFPARAYADPVRFHRIRENERERLPDMPELP